MSGIDLALLGITAEELQQRVVSQIVDRLLTTDEDNYIAESNLRRELDNKIAETANAKLAELFALHVAPNVGQYIDALTLQRTNQWGEKTGEPKTFTEYLVERADAYLREPVNYEGKSRAESGSSHGWAEKGTRLASMVDRHLYVTIEQAMKDAIGGLNKTIVTAIVEQVRISAQKVVTDLKVQTTTDTKS